MELNQGSIFAVDGSVSCSPTLSIRVSMFGIWYLFLCIAVLRILESSANLILLSFFTVMTIGDIKNLSEHDFSFSICPICCNLFNSEETSSCRWTGIRRPFWWRTVYSSLKVERATWDFDCPFLVTKSGNFSATACCSAENTGEILLQEY